MLSYVSVVDINPDQLLARAVQVQEEAIALLPTISQGQSYPANADDETKEFIRFWFDVLSRRQLTALSRAIDQMGGRQKPLLWCAFSRLIITKDFGVSLARDLSHSRPHKVYEQSPVRPFDAFLSQIKFIAKNSVFRESKDSNPRAKVQIADARKLPVDADSIDAVITSPPYLNAIDYVCCSKFTLVWLGHSISELRNLRSTNVGSEVSNSESAQSDLVQSIFDRLDPDEKLIKRHCAIITRYICDMRSVAEEITRVLRPGGKAVIVIGNSTIAGHFVKNSLALRLLFDAAGLDHTRTISRELPPSRRYLPPPREKRHRNALHARMREEVVMTFRKAA
jgi:hypothetical protein